MPRAAKRKPSAAALRMRAYRARLRKQGLRPVQIWVPDTRDPKFRAELRRESLLLRGTRGEEEALDWIEANADTSGWEA